MGMKLYGMSMSYNTLRSTAALNEKGLDFEFSLVDLRSGAHKQPPFLALNPFGQIPVLNDGDTILFESRAINRYIATKYKETGVDLLPADISAAAVEVWLEVESQQFGNPAGDLVFQQLLILPIDGRRQYRPSGRREAIGEAGEGAGRVRGAPRREQVPGRG